MSKKIKARHTQCQSLPIRCIPAVPLHGSEKDCDVVLISDYPKLERVLKEAGADPKRDVAVKVVLPNKVRMIVVWFDPDAPSTSSARVAEHVSSLLTSGEHDIRLRLDDVNHVHHERIVLDSVKASYAALFNEVRPKLLFSAYLGKTTDKAASHLEEVAKGIVFAAELENRPSNLVGPPQMAEALRSEFKGSRVNVKIIDSKGIKKMGMGLVHGIGKSGERPPCVVVLSLSNSNAKRANKRTIALLGKGVTYDAGGMTLKSADSMYGMHGDKSGAAVVAAIVRFFESHVDMLGNTDIVAVLPFVENLVNEKAVRPGDVLTAYGGTTVEIVDPDAEGRLILADALAYVGHAFKPDFIVDIATLTKTAELVHPDLTAVFYAEDPKIAEMVRLAGESTGERTWQMPPWHEVSYHVSSSVAEIKNYGWASQAGGFMAAMFLRHFVPKSCGPKGWVHIDLSKNTVDDASGVPFVGCGVALGIRVVCGLLGMSRNV